MCWCFWQKLTRPNVMPDIGHPIPDMRHMTYITWHTGGGEHCVKIQVPSFNGLRYTVFWRYFQKGSLTELINQLMNDKGVCRTASATPSLLITSGRKKKGNSKHIGKSHLSIDKSIQCKWKIWCSTRKLYPLKLTLQSNFNCNIHATNKTSFCFYESLVQI